MVSQNDVANLPLFDVGIFYSASKNLDYRQSALDTAEATITVFWEKGLLRYDLNSKFQDNPESFKVLLGDLTPEGFEFSRTHYEKWLRNTDRWKERGTKDKYYQTLVKAYDKYSKSA
jgi:hypothetical protein